MSDGYRVARAPDGDLLWWSPGETIPPGHTEIRPATEDERGLMRRIAAHGNPPVAWGTRIGEMMAANHEATPTPGPSAETIALVREVLEDARAQIDYLHRRFAVTGTGNTTMARISEALRLLAAP